MWRSLIYPAMASVVTTMLHFFAGIPVGWSALIAFLVWPIVGTIITSDDGLPGGWSNPDGSKIPEWETPLFWGRLSGGCAAVSLAFIVQVQFASQWLPLLILGCLIFSGTSAYLLCRPAAN